MEGNGSAKTKRTTESLSIILLRNVVTIKKLSAKGKRKIGTIIQEMLTARAVIPGKELADCRRKEAEGNELTRDDS